MCCINILQPCQIKNLKASSVFSLIPSASFSFWPVGLVTVCGRHESGEEEEVGRQVGEVGEERQEAEVGGRRMAGDGKGPGGEWWHNGKEGKRKCKRVVSRWERGIKER
ncbi:hypothetical protein Pmani_019263 [Petrolisthes manimaculis]|uniref:Uncharacterized protein n=1 Tax=Petrolisthes manimaculis TaxID=1843537 RepID=A0AAE1PJY2_9EUCA|nr:hypothetical protein Pmani_019263 [Petrolisthes manimaculis]